MLVRVMRVDRFSRNVTDDPRNHSNEHEKETHGDPSFDTRLDKQKHDDFESTRESFPCERSAFGADVSLTGQAEMACLVRWQIDDRMARISTRQFSREMLAA